MIKLHTKPIFTRTSKFDLALVDGDIIAYSVAAACDGRYYAVVDANDLQEMFRCEYKKELDEYLKDNPLQKDQIIVSDYEPEAIESCLHSVNMMTNSILESVGAKDYQIYLSGDNNFRFKINPEYKRNRASYRTPYHLKNCREHLVKKYQAIFTNGYEADDALGINQKDNTVICSIDKDLNCVPGWHYTWAHHGKDELLYHVSTELANRNLYKQILTGDTTDNVQGIKGVAGLTAERILVNGNVKEMYDNCLHWYQWYKNPVRTGFTSQVNIAKKTINKVANQIYILRGENEHWKEPT
jgi:hypothetical protein